MAEVKKLPKTSGTKMILAYHHEACELYFDGKNTDTIAEILNKKYGLGYTGRAIRHWFTANHYIRNYYDSYAVQRIEAIKKFTQDLFESNVDKAAGTLMKVMAGMGTPAQVSAAKEWLDRGMGKVADNLNLKGSIGVYSIADLIANEEKDEHQIREEVESEPGGISKDLLA